MADWEGVGRRVAEEMATWPEVEAVAMGGSHAADAADEASDLDLYVYGAFPPPIERRLALTADSPRAELDNRFFEHGDEWIDASSGLQLDVMYRTRAWIEADLDRVLVRHEACVGYSTCFWDNLRAARPLYDRDGWYTALHARAQAAYPEPLRRAIVAKNRPLLAASMSSFAAQLERAVSRGDRVSANHRAAAFLASYFDALFALNRATHPGEKRLVEHASRRCPKRPAGLDGATGRLLQAAACGDAAAGPAARELAAGLDVLLREDGLLPTQ